MGGATSQPGTGLGRPLERLGGGGAEGGEGLTPLLQPGVCVLGMEAGAGAAGGWCLQPQSLRREEVCRRERAHGREGSSELRGLGHFPTGQLQFSFSVLGDERFF